MLWFIQNILFSISLIVVIHYLYIYFETTLTAPKVKDLIHCPKQKYKSLFDTINKNLDNNIIQSSGSGAAGGGGTRNSSAAASASASASASDPASASASALGIDHNEPVYDEIRRDDKNNGGNDMKTDLKAFLRGIGLKSKSSSEIQFHPSYEMS